MFKTSKSMYMNIIICESVSEVTVKLIFSYIVYMYIYWNLWQYISTCHVPIFAFLARLSLAWLTWFIESLMLFVILVITITTWKQEIPNLINCSGKTWPLNCDEKNSDDQVVLKFKVTFKVKYIFRNACDIISLTKKFKMLKRQSGPASSRKAKVWKKYHLLFVDSNS